MIVVIQCAASKQPGAGHMVTPDGMPVDFVADPQAGPANHGTTLPKVESPGGSSWLNTTSSQVTILSGFIQRTSSTKEISTGG